MERKQYRNCLVGLDRSDSDKCLVAQLSLLEKQISIQKIIFAHVDQFKPEPPAEPQPELRGAGHSDTDLREVGQLCPDEAAFDEMSVLTLTGHPETALAECVVKYDIDLICVGLKDSSSRFAKIGRKLLTLTDADVLFIPPIRSRNFERILIPADLSEKSFDLVEKTRAQFPLASIEIFFVNYIPPETVMDKNDRDKLIGTSSKNLEISMSGFIENLSCNTENISYGYAMSEHFNAGYAIYEHAVKARFDLIVVGRLSSLDKELPFLGSVTEKILSLSNQLPVLVINH